MKVTLLDYNGSGTKHYTVAWVTTESGTFIKTLRKQGPSSWTSSEWTSHCGTWKAARGTSTAFDGYTSSTATTYSGTNSPVVLTWNCKDAADQLMPDGNYRFWVQYAENSGQGPYTTAGLLWTKGPAGGTTTYPNQGSNFANMSVVWSPAYVPPPKGEITSVNVQGSAIIITGAGTVSATYTVIGTSDLAQPIGSWTPIQSGTINGDGSFSNSLPIMPFLPSRYYRIQLP